MFEIRQVWAGYGPQTVLKNVSVKVPTGAVVALLGSNGAGKTTLLRVASGLLKPSSGALLLEGQDFTGAKPYQLVDAGVCHIPEGRGVFGSLTVRDNLEIQSRIGSPSDAVSAAVGVFPALGRRIDQLAGTLSGGEQQMLALARAYIQQPRVVLLDEVSMGLAPVVVDEIFDFIRLLSAGGTSLLLVEQYVTRALQAADYVYILNRGVVAFAGEPTELDSRDIFHEYVGADLG